MAERRLFRHSMMSLTGFFIALACGLAAGAAEDLSKATPTARYMAEVVAAVEKQWLLYKSQRPDGVDPGQVQTEFYVTKHGAVETPRAVNTEESDPILTGLALRAIRDAALPPMPKDVFYALPPGDQGRLKIEYTASILPHGTKSATASTPPDKAPLEALLDQADKDSSKTEFTAPKALPVEDDEPGARSTPRQNPNAFLPFTRTAQTNDSTANRRRGAPAEDDTPKGRYIRQVLAAVEKKWRLYIHLRRASITYGHLEIEFYINKKSKVEDLRVINDKDSNDVLADLTQQAIRDATIPPMPADVIPQLSAKDQGRLKIEYNALIY